MGKVDGMASSEPDRTPPLDRARALFVKYDGSGFFMSRDDVYWEYRGYGVPPDVESQWRDELTAEKIAELDQPGNWRSLHYLCHHEDTRFLHEVVRAEPLGELWKRIAYLELLLKYVERCRAFYPRRDIRTAVQTVLTRTAALDIDNAPKDELDGREEQLRGRARKLAETAALILSTPPGPRWLARIFAALRPS
jgi:hypothetical protein